VGHDLAELTTGLASRVNSLAKFESGPDSRSLFELQDRLVKLAMLAIIKNLHAEQADYQVSIKGLKEANDYIGNADKKIGNVPEAIKLASKAADLVEKVLTRV
jgi:hypothetical protein